MYHYASKSIPELIFKNISDARSRLDENLKIFDIITKYKPLIPHFPQFARYEKPSYSSCFTVILPWNSTLRKQISTRMNMYGWTLRHSYEREPGDSYCKDIWENKQIVTGHSSYPPYKPFYLEFSIKYDATYNEELEEGNPFKDSCKVICISTEYKHYEQRTYDVICNQE